MYTKFINAKQEAVQKIQIENMLLYSAYRSNNFIVGLTNVSPVVSTPTLWNYTLCGQYPGAVPAGATVSLYCPYNLPPFRYVIVQFPVTDYMNICELEVFAPGKPKKLKYAILLLYRLALATQLCIN